MTEGMSSNSFKH